MKKDLAIVLCTAMFVVSGCGGTSAEELTEYYSELAKQEAVETAKEVANSAASSINSAIDNNETTSKVKEGVTTAGEYIEDAYDYATDEDTIHSAKETAKEVGDDSVGFFNYMISKIQYLWGGVVENIEKGPAGADTTVMNNIEDLQNASEYDFYGNYTNPWLEAKGIDTTSDGTAMEQLSVAFDEFTKSAKETIQNIKQNHDEKHGTSTTSETTSSTEEAATVSNGSDETTGVESKTYAEKIAEVLYPQIPEFSGNAYCIVNKNNPFFDESELTTDEFEMYSELDSLGRCGVAYANISPSTLPTEERTSIGSIKPTGWVQAKYDILKNEENTAGFLYARCHLIAHSLAGENSNPLNLITGTLTQFNVVGMEPFEMAVLYYVRNTGNHVMYRVTPIFNGNELVAKGVLMEAKSIEDDEISFCVYVYNVAPGITIDYATGRSRLAE